MKNEVEKQIFEKMKAKDFGESMCNETKLNVLKWTILQLRKHDVIKSVCDCIPNLYKDGIYIKCSKCNRTVNIHEQTVL
jgi:hypothetical protein